MYKDNIEIKRFTHPKEAADYVGVNESCIRGCIYGTIHFVKGFTFKYADGSGKWSNEHIREQMDRNNANKRLKYNKKCVNN